jgi:hypothetical protein
MSLRAKQNVWLLRKRISGFGGILKAFPLRKSWRNAASLWTISRITRFDEGVAGKRPARQQPRSSPQRSVSATVNQNTATFSVKMVYPHVESPVDILYLS